MLKKFRSKKTLELVIMAQLLCGMGVAYGQTSTTMVTAGNTADTPYTAITVTQAAGSGSTKETDQVYYVGAVKANNAADMTLYMSGDGTISVKDDGSSVLEDRQGSCAAAVTGIWAESAAAAHAITVQGKAAVDVEAAKATFTANDDNYSYLGLYSYGIQVGNYNTVTLADGSSTKAQSSFGNATFNAGAGSPAIELHTYGTYAEPIFLLVTETVPGKVVLGKNTEVTAVSTVGSATITGTAAPYIYTEAIGINTPFTAGENLKIEAKLETAAGAMISGTNSTISEGVMRAAGIHIIDTNYTVPEGTEITATAKAPEFKVLALSGLDVTAVGIDAFSTVDTQGITIKTSVDSQYAKTGNKNINYYARAIAANDGAIVNVNQAGGKNVILEGDLFADSGTTINAKLNTAASYFQGNIVGEGTVNLSLASGASWRPVYDNRNGSYNVMGNQSSIKAADYKVAAVSAGSVALNDGGIIDLTWDGWKDDGTYDTTRAYRSGTNNSFRSLTVDSLSGAGGILKIDSDLANSRADTLTVGSASTATALKVQINYDDFFANSAKGDIVSGKALVVTDNSSGKTLTVTGTKSEYNEKTYEVTVAKDATNTNQWNLVKIEDVTGSTPTPTPTPTPSNITENTKHAADSRDNVNNIWEVETNSLVKRLGDLRSMSKDISKHDNMWAKYGHGNQKLGEGRDTELNYNQFQLGYDKGFDRKDGKIYRGVMVSRINGDADYERGSGDTNSTTLGLYQTWLGNKGHYYDVTFRYGKIDTDYNVTDLSGNYSTGDYDMWATTLSGEYGYRKALGKGAYFEPSAELILGHVGSADYTTSKNMDVYLDAAKHAVTRLGFMTGKDFGRGEAYFKANYFHDFAGDGSVTTGSVTYENDQPKNWWELGIGGDVKMGKNASAYAEVRKLFGDLKSNVNFSIGARWSF